MVSGLTEALGHGRDDLLDAKTINGVLAAINAIGAKDEVEGMLGTLRVATRRAAMSALARLARSAHPLEEASSGNMANKFLRTFPVLMEALDRHRGKGQPAVHVEQVNVNSGGQAIVGAVTTSGTVQKPEAHHEPPGITNEPGTPMRSPDTEREAVPVARAGEQ